VRVHMGNHPIGMDERSGGRKRPLDQPVCEATTWGKPPEMTAVEIDG
jgi:hypothetical protein